MSIKTLRASNGLVISFISSGMGSIDYMVAETGLNRNDDIRLRIKNDDMKTGKYLSNKGSTITPERVAGAYNEYKEAQRAEFLVWAEKNDINLDEYPATPKLLNVIAR